MRVLITGANGFIGRKCMEIFIQEGHTVEGWVRIEQGTSACNLKKVNLMDTSAIEDALLAFHPNVIVHCAGAADVGKSVENPEMDFQGNVRVTHNLLFSLHKTCLEKIRVVFLSSAGVYGNPISLPIKENMPLNPLSPYAVHKVMCEDLCRYFKNNYGMDIKIARIFSAYGSGLRKQIFWDMQKKAVNFGRLDMFGTGKESRDYIHVKDVVQCLYLLATKESNYLLFNVANGEEITIRRVTEIFAEEFGLPKTQINFNGHTREGDPINWRADISRIQELGYKKTVNIDDGIAEYCKWCKGIIDECSKLL